MILISARQAWHDAFYQRTSKNEEISGPSKFGDAGLHCHRATAGRIQSAISFLPEILRRFGMMMYAPPNFIYAEDVEIPIDWLSQKVAANYLKREKPLSHAHFEILPLLVRAMLMRHRELVARRPDPFKSNNQLRKFIREELGVILHPENFHRNYGLLIETIKTEIDRLDKKCLVPVSKVIEQYQCIAEIQKDDSKSWMIRFTESMWNECFSEIKMYCESAL